MQVVSQEFCTSRAAVTVENCEKAYFLLCWDRFTCTVVFFHVKNDRNPIFVVRSDDAVVSIGGVGFNYSKRFNRTFTRIDGWNRLVLVVRREQILCWSRTFCHFRKWIIVHHFISRGADLRLFMGWLKCLVTQIRRHTTYTAAISKWNGRTLRQHLMRRFCLSWRMLRFRRVRLLLHKLRWRLQLTWRFRLKLL